MFCTTSQGVHVVGPDMGDAAQPCPPHNMINCMAKPLHEPLPMPGKLEQICLINAQVFLLYIHVIQSSNVLFSHPSFAPSHKYLTGRAHGKPDQVT